MVDNENLLLCYTDPPVGGEARHAKGRYPGSHPRDMVLIIRLIFNGGLHLIY